MPMPAPPVILWLRRDLRLSDHPALAAACAEGPVIPLFILDDQTNSIGAAPKWRMGLSIAQLAKDLEGKGSRLILRRGEALDVLRDVIAQTGARSVMWSRYLSPKSIGRDMAVKSALKKDGIETRSFEGQVLFDPWTVETKTGGFYRVYTPLWNEVKTREVPEPLPAPRDIPAPQNWPKSDDLDSWDMGQDMQRGAQIVAKHVHVGEGSARARLSAFITHRIETYGKDRDRMDIHSTSGLSENLTYGEISPRSVWHAGLRARAEGAKGAEKFLKELVWRDFAWHLMYHTPHLERDNWREEWAAFPWQPDSDNATRWRRGLTGEPMVDAGMREMYVTGHMHNRVRMIVASYLTKNMMTHWKVGMDWFAQCLVDWDPASNALGWQWTAGSGPDAAPYFRVFNPETQGEKFDTDETYRKKYIAGYGPGPQSQTALDYFKAVPVSWNLKASGPYPDRMISLKEGRQTALDAYETFKGA